MINHFRQVPLLAIAARSGTGKTTLLRQVIPLLTERGMRVAVVKHAHHEFDIDHPGKDSYLLRQAGARQISVGSSYRAALVIEQPVPREVGLSDLLQNLRTDDIDIILVEGFRDAAVAKLELRRSGFRNKHLHPEDKSVIGIITDDAPTLTEAGDCPIPVLDLMNLDQIVQFICSYRDATIRSLSI